jgi:hypothetical protein
LPSANNSGADAHDYHESGENCAGIAQLAMDVHAAGGNQGRLGDEEHNPGAEKQPVNMEDGQQRLAGEHRPQVVAAVKAGKHGEEHRYGNACVEGAITGSCRRAQLDGRCGGSRMCHFTP